MVAYMCSHLQRSWKASEEMLLQWVMMMMGIMVMLMLMVVTEGW